MRTRSTAVPLRRLAIIGVALTRNVSESHSSPSQSGTRWSTDENCLKVRKDNVNNALPIPTASGKIQLAWGMTCGKRPTASAGVTYTRLRRNVTTPASIARIVDSKPGPKRASAATPAAAVIMQTHGNIIGRCAHGHMSACANISKAMTTRGGKKIILIPTHVETRYASSKNAVKNGTHVNCRGTRSSSSSRTSTGLDRVESSLAAKSPWFAIDRPASKQVPTSIEAGYYQLVSPSANARKQAEIAGATGDRSTLMIAIDPRTHAAIDQGPYGM